MDKKFPPLPGEGRVGAVIRITTDASEIDLRLAHRWISSSYWSTNIPWERFERACTNSLVYAAFDGDDQVGFARVVTDSATFAWLCDVFVAENARGRGIGQRMIAAIMAGKFGFQPMGEPDGRFMRIACPPAEVNGS